MYKHISVFFILCLFLTGCSASGNEAITRQGFYFDTIIQISFYPDGQSSKEAEELADECLALCETYESLFSSTVEGSDIWNLNHAKGTPVRLSGETISLLQKACDYSTLSDGAFDCTIAPLSSLWDFKNNTGTIPSSASIEDARSLVSYQNIKIDGLQVSLSEKEAAVDLGGIAKGYIADELVSFLSENGISSALINLGGNVKTLGTKPDGSYWNIAVKKPFGKDGEASCSVKLKDQSLVTSGCYERYFEKDGRLYHHILDPFTGYPADNGLYSVTILGSSSADGDALSTTCFLLGLDDGMRLIESLENTEAVFITNDQQLHYSSGFPQ